MHLCKHEYMLIHNDIYLFKHDVIYVVYTHTTNIYTCMLQYNEDIVLCVYVFEISLIIMTSLLI